MIKAKHIGSQACTQMAKYTAVPFECLLFFSQNIFKSSWPWRRPCSMLSWQPSKRWVLPRAACCYGIRNGFNIFRQVLWRVSNIRCKERGGAELERRVPWLALVLKLWPTLLSSFKAIHLVEPALHSPQSFVYIEQGKLETDGGTKRWKMIWEDELVGKYLEHMTMRTHVCEIFCSSMVSSFLQLMSKDTISAFGPELSGDLEQQVSGDLKRKQNGKILLSSKQTVVVKNLWRETTPMSRKHY